MPVTAILDVDGTLVDTNYHHALAWHRALRANGQRVQMWQIHRHIGMGGDKIIAALIGEVEPLEGARELLEDLRTAEVRAILASSAKQEEVDHYLDLLEARELVNGWTSSADVERTKPAADLVRAALDEAGGGPALMIGDSIWDVKAASAAGVPTLAVLTGGFSEAELREAGAIEVVESIAALRGEGEKPGEWVTRLSGDPLS